MILMRLINAPKAVQNAVAILISGLMLLFVWIGLSFAAGVIISKASRLTEMRERAGRLTQMIALRDAAKLPVEVGGASGGESLFVEAESVAIGRANLQSRIEAIAQGNGLLLSSAGGLPDSEEDGLKLVGLRIDLSGAHDAINKAMADMEISKPPLIIREVSIRLAAGEGGDRPPELAAQIKLYSAFRQSSPAASGPPSNNGAKQ